MSGRKRDLNRSSPSSSANAQLRDLRAERRDLKRDLALAQAEVARLKQAQEQNQWSGSPTTGQNEWHREDCSLAVTFLSPHHASSPGFDSDPSVSSMPGIHALRPIKHGKTIQNIFLTGGGYTLVGLVTTDEQKEHLRHRADRDWDTLPFMKSAGMGPEHMITIQIDMTQRRAVIGGEVLTGLPDEVWVAVAFKRNQPREAAVLMPYSHWE